MPSATAELAELLANSHSKTIYLDLDINDKDAEAMLTADPPLHVEHDVVRGLWAVRAATEDEIPAKAAEPASASSAGPASSPPPRATRSTASA